MTGTRAGLHDALVPEGNDVTKPRNSKLRQNGVTR